MNVTGSFFRIGFCLLLLLTTLVSSNYSFAQPENDDEQAPPSPAEVAGREIHIVDADLATIIKTFSRITKRNYILDEKVKGKVSINLPGKVSDSESIRILDAILALKGFTSVPIGDNLWKVVPIKDARRTTIPTQFEESEIPASAQVVTRVIRLQNVSADDMQKLISQLISTDGLINAYSRTNSLLIVDSEDNIERIADIIEAVDVPSSDRDMTIIPVKNADAVEITETLKEILQEDDNAQGSDASATGDTRLDLIRSRIRDAARRPDQPSEGGGAPLGADGGDNVSIVAAGAPPKIVADQRTNSVIVVANDSDTARIKALISQLDSEMDLSGFRFYVYRCQHADAEELAEVLGNLTGAATSVSGGGSDNLTNASTGLSRVNQNERSQRGQTSQRTEERLASQRRTPGRSRSETSRGTSSGGSPTANFGEDLSITADPATNSLIIFGSKTDYEKIKGLLKDLDVKRRQVLVEALILEVRVTDSETLGTEFVTSTGGSDGGVLASSNFGNITQLLSDPTQLSNFSIAAASSGTLTLPGGITIPTQTVLVSAAMTNQNVNVLSAPNILATDNEQAEIVIGQNVPFVASTSTSTDNLNNTFNQIDRQDVGITLRLTPQISSGEFVTLNLFTEVSSVVADTATSNLGPTTTIRTSETTVITKNGQMVVIGGLIADGKTVSERGIPFLKDIPFLGYAFKITSENTERNNLLIFITPKIVKDQFDHRDITLEARGPVEQNIAAGGVVPDRSEVLRHLNQDRVAEAEDFDGQKPTTIRPPAPVAAPSDLDLDEPLELSSSADNLSPAASLNTGAAYIVLQKTGSDLDERSRAMIPFAPSDAGRVGVIVPAETISTSKQFFSVGSDCAYQIGEVKWPLKVVGSFASPTEASTLFPDLATTWYTLSPYEIINLGKGPWHNG